MKAYILRDKVLSVTLGVSIGYKNTFQACCGRDLGTDFLDVEAIKGAFGPENLGFMSNLLERGRYFSRVVWLTPCLAISRKWNLNGTSRHADNF